MAQKIKFNIIQSLFQLFSFLADKTGGWAMFVKPKILLGSVILGLSACSSNAVKQENDVLCYLPLPDDYFLEQTDTTKVETEKSDSIVASQKPTPITPPIEVTCYVPVVTCYDISIEEFEIEEFEVDTNNYIYQVFEIEQKPDFPGGMEALYKFIGTNLRYPQVMQENGIQGKVVCQFIIEKGGKISNVKVIKGLDPAGDKEAVRVIESMPDWIPGKQNGIPVRVKYTIPINFKIQ